MPELTDLEKRMRERYTRTQEHGWGWEVEMFLGIWIQCPTERYVMRQGAEDARDSLARALARIVEDETKELREAAKELAEAWVEHPLMAQPYQVNGFCLTPTLSLLPTSVHIRIGLGSVLGGYID